MKKSELLSALQNEIQRHNLDTFMSAEHKIVQTGCSFCERHLSTVEQFNGFRFPAKPKSKAPRAGVSARGAPKIHFQ
jgi:hypothetical protein